jgi:hypothetical protein
MQMAADSTALMLSKNAATLDNSQLQTKANEYFKALFTRTDASGLAVSATYSTANGSQVVLNATSNVKTSFMGLMGFNSLNVAVNSQVAWGNTKLRVALVLDTTGSMASAGKMDALKAATKSLLTTLKNSAAKDGDVHVSIIPFSKDINVGPKNYKKNWIDWTEWDFKNGKCSKKKPNHDEYENKLECTLALGNWNPDNHITWNGCVMDRGLQLLPSILNTDTNVLPVDLLNLETKYAAEQYKDCSPPIMPLSYDWSAMNDLVDSFYPAGMTNQGIGLAHGWMSLVGGGPYPPPPPEDPNYKYSKIIILMSDGLNTQNRWYKNAGQIDGRQQMTCNNVKAAGVTVYTIHVNTDGDPMSTLLKSCASAPDKFWMLTSASQLVGTFNTIGTNLANLRIAK